MCCLPIVIAVALAQAAPPSTQAAAPAAATHRELVTTYSNGRTSVQVLKPKGGFWTPNFPHQPVPKTQDGLALAALQVDYVLESDGVAATVSLKYGNPHQRTIPVASVRLTDDQPVDVPQLADFGVDPITLVVREALPAALVQPAVASVSAAIDVRIVLPAADVPLYTITLTNRAARTVRAVQYKMYRGDTEVGSGRRGGDASGLTALPAMGPDGGRNENEFTISAASSDGPQGFDRFAVTAVLWDDWSIEGDENLKTSVLMVAAGVNQQLRRVIALLQDPSIGSIADLRREVEALPIDGHNSSEMIGQRQVIDAVLADLKAVLPRQSWRQDGITRYSEWLTRLR
jgi:hypothetical protein